jgi:hypothetical protein
MMSVWQIRCLVLFKYFPIDTLLFKKVCRWRCLQTSGLNEFKNKAMFCWFASIFLCFPVLSQSPHGEVNKILHKMQSVFFFNLYNCLPWIPLPWRTYLQLNRYRYNHWKLWTQNAILSWNISKLEILSRLWWTYTPEWLPSDTGMNIWCSPAQTVNSPGQCSSQFL